MNELVSAMSALNMEASPIDPAPVREPNSRPVYLSESDSWAKHAMEHLHAVFELLQRADREREADRTKIYRLGVKLAKLRKAFK
jgi:hypothetical protein